MIDNSIINRILPVMTSGIKVVKQRSGQILPVAATEIEKYLKKTKELIKSVK